MFDRLVGKIKHNGREATCLQQQIGCPNGLIEADPRLRLFGHPSMECCGLLIYGFVCASHPKQMPEVDTIGRSGFGIEGIASIDPCANASMFGAARQEGKGNVGSA